MRRTTAVPLIVLAVVGAIVGWAMDNTLTASGQPIYVPPISLPISLLAIAVIVVLLAVPVRRAVAEHNHNRVDPFYATRVVVLAKASSLAGAMLGGFGLGILIYLLGRPVVTSGSVVAAIASSVGAAILLVAGLVAEHMCAIPPEDDENANQEPSTASQ